MPFAGLDELEFAEGVGEQLPQLNEFGLAESEIEIGKRSAQNNLVTTRTPTQAFFGVDFPEVLLQYQKIPAGKKLENEAEFQRDALLATAAQGHLPTGGKGQADGFGGSGVHGQFLTDEWAWGGGRKQFPARAPKVLFI